MTDRLNSVNKISLFTPKPRAETVCVLLVFPTSWSWWESGLERLLPPDLMMCLYWKQASPAGGLESRVAWPADRQRLMLQQFPYLRYLPAPSLSSAFSLTPLDGRFGMSNRAAALFITRAFCCCLFVFLSGKFLNGWRWILFNSFDAEVCVTTFWGIRRDWTDHTQEKGKQVIMPSIMPFYWGKDSLTYRHHSPAYFTEVRTVWQNDRDHSPAYFTEVRTVWQTNRDHSPAYFTEVRTIWHIDRDHSPAHLTEVRTIWHIDRDHSHVYLTEVRTIWHIDRDHSRAYLTEVRTIWHIDPDHSRAYLTEVRTIWHTDRDHSHADVTEVRTVWHTDCDRSRTYLTEVRTIWHTDRDHSHAYFT